MEGEKFSIHVRALGSGFIVWNGGFTIILALNESPWWWFALLLLTPVMYAMWRNERLPGGVEK